MSYTIDFVGVASAIFVSFAVALGLEWLSLVLMMRLMPAKPEPRTVRQRMAAQTQHRTPLSHTARKPHRGWHSCCGFAPLPLARAERDVKSETHL